MPIMSEKWAICSAAGQQGGSSAQGAMEESIFNERHFALHGDIRTLDMSVNPETQKQVASTYLCSHRLLSLVPCSNHLGG